MYRHKQKRLPLEDEDALESMWETFSQAQREEVIAHYARLIVAAMDNEAALDGKETIHDENTDG